MFSGFTQPQYIKTRIIIDSLLRYIFVEYKDRQSRIIPKIAVKRNDIAFTPYAFLSKIHNVQWFWFLWGQGKLENFNMGLVKRVSDCCKYSPKVSKQMQRFASVNKLFYVRTKVCV